MDEQTHAITGWAFGDVGFVVSPCGASYINMSPGLVACESFEERCAHATTCANSRRRDIFKVGDIAFGGFFKLFPQW